MQARLLAALTVALAVGFGAAPTVARAQGAGGDALTTLQQCVSSGRPLQALLLVDTSASLKKSDPADRRVVALTSAIRGLSSIAASAGTGGGSARVDVALAGFGEHFEMVEGWAAIDGASTERFVAAAASFATRDRAIDTDYYDALLAARQSLGDHGRAFADATPCEALLWFTDGKYEISDRRPTKGTKAYAPDITLGTPGSGAKIAAIGSERLCAPDGVVDGLHADGVGIVTVALATTLDPAARDFLGAVATGTSGARTCGQRGTAATGTVLLAEDATSVVAAFDRVAAQIAGAEPLPRIDAVAPCRSEPCTDGGVPFTLDAQTRGVHLFIRTGRPDATVVLRLPDGGRAALRRGGPGRIDAGTTRVSQSWIAADLVAVDIVTTPPPAAPVSGTMFVVGSGTASATVWPYRLPVPVAPITVPPTTVAPPTTLAATTLAPTTAAPTTAAPTTLAPTTVAPTVATAPAVTEPPAKAADEDDTPFPIVPLLAGLAAALALAAAIAFLRARRKAQAASALPPLDGVSYACIPIRVQYGLTPDIVSLDARGAEHPFRVTREIVSNPVRRGQDGRIDVEAFRLERSGDGLGVRVDGMRIVSSANRAGTLEDAGASARLPIGLGSCWAFATRADQLQTVGAVVAGLDETRTVDLSQLRGLADPALDGEIVLFLSTRADAGQLEQSVRHLLPALAQAVVAASMEPDDAR